MCGRNATGAETAAAGALPTARNGRGSAHCAASATDHGTLLRRVTPCPFLSQRLRAFPQKSGPALVFAHPLTPLRRLHAACVCPTPSCAARPTSRTTSQESWPTCETRLACTLNGPARMCVVHGSAPACTPFSSSAALPCGSALDSASRLCLGLCLANLPRGFGSAPSPSPTALPLRPLALPLQLPCPTASRATAHTLNCSAASGGPSLATATASA